MEGREEKVGKLV